MKLSEWTKIQRENYAYITWREADENCTRAAALLGIHRNTLRILVRDYKRRTPLHTTEANHG